MPLSPPPLSRPLFDSTTLCFSLLLSADSIDPKQTLRKHRQRRNELFVLLEFALYRLRFKFAAHYIVHSRRIQIAPA
jgi:hypothetical protein